MLTAYNDFWKMVLDVEKPKESLNFLPTPKENPTVLPPPTPQLNPNKAKLPVMVR